MKIKLNNLHLDKTKLGHPVIGNQHHAPLFMDVDVVLVDCDYYVSVVFRYASTPRIRFWESITGWRWKEVADGVLMDKKTQRISEIQFDMRVTEGYGALVRKLHSTAYAAKANIWTNSSNALMVAEALLQNKTKIADHCWKRVYSWH